MLKKVLSAVLLLAGVVVAAGSYAGYWLQQPAVTAEQTIMLPPGTGQRRIAATLAELDNQSGATLWLAALELSKRAYGAQIKAGEYQLDSGLTRLEILKLLSSGKTIQHRLTLVEGWTSVQILSAINNDPILSGDPVRDLAEGSILPDTYFFTRGTTRSELISRMQQQQQRLLNTIWHERSADNPLQTPEEAIILASIIERETAKAEEYTLVASVYTNRLRINMPLQADPTVVYAVSNGSGDLGRPLSRADLRFASAFNTYLNNGLPPAPICHPSAGALRAALNPARTEYFYFVADGKGGHAFGKTLDEHNRNVAAWRALR